MNITTSGLRSKLSREILGALALQVAAPIAIAELWESLRVAAQAGRSLSRFVRAIQGPKSFIYTYLYRLADRGLVRIQGARMRKRVLLTAKGRRILAEFQAEQERRSYAPRATDEGELRRRIEPLPGEVARQEEMEEKRRRWHRKSSGKGGAVFLSYDVPVAWNERRDWLRERLEALGFERFHESFYLGNQKLLRQIVEEGETWGLVPYLCWGRIEVLAG